MLLPPHDGRKEPPREPRLRLIVCYGAGDSYAAEWANWEHEVPSSIEMMTYETPGHGTRDDDRVLNSLDDVVEDAFATLREAMSTGAFAFLGHSIGCLIATGVAERASRELGVEPLFAFMLDRGPPHISAQSVYGAELSRSDGLRFLEGWMPMQAKLAAQDTKGGRHALQMLSNDLQLEHQTHEPGWYVFPCPIYAMVCTSGTDEEWHEPAEVDALAEDDIVRHMMSLRPTRTREDGKIFRGHFTPRECEEWSQWTNHPKGATVMECPGTNHFSIKSSEFVRESIASALTELIARF